MTAKFLFLYSIVFLLFSCAAQGIPSGGPPDKVGPILISIQPENETLGITLDQKIILGFNELLDPVSIPASISLEEDFQVKVRGRRIIINPDKTWPENRVLNIKLSRKIRDYQKNIMAEPIQLVYSTGAYIPAGHIRGKIEEYSPNKLIEVGLYNWPIHDSSKVIQQVEVDKNGFFKFGYIDYGKYILGAIEAVITDIGTQIYRKNYAMLTSEYILLSQNNTAQHVQMLLSKPLERLKITSVKMKSQYCTNLIMNDQSEEIFIIDTLYTPGDSIKINMIKSNRMETYVLPEYAFILPEITDTTGPNYESSEFMHLKFSEPVRLAPEAVVTEQDSLDISLHFKMENSFTIILSSLADTITRIKLLGDYIQDFHGNIMADSVKHVFIKQMDEEEIIIGGNILGTVKYAGTESLEIEARNIENDQVYTAKVKKKDFKLENLQAGVYKLWAFESLLATEPGTYFSGTWAPYSRAAHFVLYPDSVDVRTHWDVDGIIIDFEEN